MHILAATDFSPRSEIAIAKAARLAKRCGANLTLLHAIDKSFFERLLASDQEAAAQTDAEAKLREIARAIGAEVQVRAAVGDSAETIVGVATETKADLIVIGDHGESRLRDLFLGTTAKNTIERSSAALLIVKNERLGDHSKILLATDFSEGSKEAIGYAYKLFADADFLIFNAYLAPEDILSGFYSVATSEAGTTLEALRNQSLKAMDRFVASLNIPAERLSSSVRASTNPSDDILQFSRDEGVDLIVVGTKGVGGLMPLIIGSATDSLLRHSEVDMLVLKV
ncbi:hypothetical protein AGMMS50229_14000 [Campylobacterota bacterium]|nr:hypothetical protein AGMMS50229_14000 [Campylobacterota bacterium]